MCRSCVILFIISIGAVCRCAGKTDCIVIRYSSAKWFVDCANKHLSQLPDYSDRPVDYLILSNNSFNSSISFRGWSSLKSIDLSFNNLTDIGNSTLEGLKDLYILNISYCSLTSISSPHLKGQTLVKRLDLSGNPQLQYSNDFLVVLNKSLDRGTTSLYLSDIGLSNFSDTFFVNAKTLSVLHLNNNFLKELPVFPEKLFFLDISNNSFTTLTTKPFKNCTQLKTLLAENNENLTEIDEDAFLYLENLDMVSLRGNRKLDFIPSDLFYHTQNLRLLILSGCNFKTLSAELKPLFMDLQLIELDDNPWECNSSIKWLSTLNSSTISFSDVMCVDGTSLAKYLGLMKSALTKHVIYVLVVMTFSFFFIGLWFVYDLEKKRKRPNPYLRLGKTNRNSTPVYVSTVV